MYTHREVARGRARGALRRWRGQVTRAKRGRLLEASAGIWYSYSHPDDLTLTPITPRSPDLARQTNPHNPTCAYAPYLHSTGTWEDCRPACSGRGARRGVWAWRRGSLTDGGEAPLSTALPARTTSRISSRRDCILPIHTCIFLPSPPPLPHAPSYTPFDPSVQSLQGVDRPRPVAALGAARGGRGADGGCLRPLAAADGVGDVHRGGTTHIAPV